MNKYMSPTTPPALILSPQAFSGGPETDVGKATTSIGHLGDVLRRRWLTLLWCAMTAAIAAGALGLRMPRLYTGWAQVVITPQVPQTTAGATDRGGEEAMMTIETQVSILQSRDLIGRVLARLVSMPGFPILDFGREGTVRHVSRLMAERVEQRTAGTWISAALGSGWTAGLRSFAALPAPRQRREIVIDELSRNLRANSEPRSRVVSVRYTAVSPELAALITNTVIETYIAAQRSSKREGIRLKLERLEKELPALHSELLAANAQIRAYRLEHAVPDPTSTELQEQQAVALKTSIKTIDADLAQAEADQAALGRLRESPQTPPVSTRYSGTLAHLQDEELQRARMGLDPNGRPRPPDASSVNADRARIRERIVAEVDLASARAADETAMLLQRRQALQEQLDTMQVSLGETQPAADHLKELLRLVEAKRQVYEEGLLEQQRLQKEQDLVTPDAAVLSAAAPPQQPISANPILFLPPALVAGLLIGGLIAVWREAVDDALRSERLIPRVLGVPCAGFLPSRPALTKPSGELPANGLYVAALRFVLNVALRFAPQDGCRSVLVTSSISGEGSRMLAEDLAICAARLAPSVLLIDLQAPRTDGASASSRFSRTWPDGPTLTSAVPGMVLTQPLRNSGLHVLQTDGLDADAVYLLLSRDLPQSLQQMREVYDCIVIHAAPILEAASARIVVGEVDHTLVAVRWGRTSRSIVENALAALCRIESGPGKPSAFSVVLTGVNVRRHLAYRFGDAIEALIKAYRRRALA